MKKLYFLVYLSIVSALAFSQNPVPNGDLETWETNVNYLQPRKWMTNNSNNPVYLIAIPITQSSDSHTGTSAAAGEVITPLGATGNYPPAMTTIEFPITKSYLLLNFWYKLNLLGTDALHIEVNIFDQTHNLIGGGEDLIDVSASAYTLFSVPIKDTSSAIPATCTINFGILNPAESNPTKQRIKTTLGSSFLIDDVELADDQTGISSSESTKNIVSYPNPVHDKLYVTIPQQNHEEIMLTLTDPSGRIVLRKNSKETDFEELSVNHLSSGIYVFSLQSSIHNQKQLIVIQ